MLRVDDVTKSYGGRVVLGNISFQVNAGERVGVVGRNGAGKTTLLRLILTEEQPDRGAIQLMPGETFGYLSQDVELTVGNSLHEEMLSVFAAVQAIEAERRAVEKQLGDTTDESRLLELVDRHDHLLSEFQRLDGDTVEARIGTILSGLGFTQTDHGKQVDTFSGGWQMRVGLAKLLLQAPDFLLLDEPTNHLDLFAVEWLADYLESYRGAIFVVSHDRWLLDRICTRILELEGGAVTSWPGNYSAFLQAKELAQEQQAQAHERQQRYLTKQQEFIERFRGKPSKTRATQSREKLLSKMERIEAPPPPPRRLAFRFPAASPSGRETMLARRISRLFGDHLVLNDVSFTIERGDRVALVGPNGAGKTTLLRLLAHEDAPSHGTVTWGHNVLPAYFSQHQSETLDPEHTVFEELFSVAPPRWTQTETRNLLGRFLFRGEDADKLVGVLSGGERGRLALAKLLLRPTNVLLLDEPTNHLDIPAREVLEDALSAYAGAFIISTHDRYLLNQVTNKVIEIADATITLYPTGYREFAEVRRLGNRGAANLGRIVGTAPTLAPSNPVPDTRLHRRGNVAHTGKAARSVPPAQGGRSELLTTEQRIAALEHQHEEITHRLANPDLYRDLDAYQETLHDYEAIAAELAQLTQLWEELAERVEA